jgi:hypothetical protein
MAWTLQDAHALEGRTVVDPTSRRIGKIVDVCLVGTPGRRRGTRTPIPAGDIVVRVSKD